MSLRRAMEKADGRRLKTLRCLFSPVTILKLRYSSDHHLAASSHLVEARMAQQRCRGGKGSIYTLCDCYFGVPHSASKDSLSHFPHANAAAEAS